jgi:5-methylcytosine-specific restriction endonuclease McrA
MIKTIKHAIHLVQHHFRDIGISAKRSPKWEKFEKEFLAKYPTCAACGGKENLQAHHCIPFHHDSSLELNESNIITLCMAKGFDDHIYVGHGGNFKMFNPNVRADAAKLLANPSLRDEIIKTAHNNAKIN